MLLSIIPNHASFETALFQAFLSLLLVVSVWSVRKMPHRLSQQGIAVALLLCLLYYLFPMSGSDFFEYKETVETAGYTNMDLITQYTFHMEKPYWLIVNVVHNNYLLFRLVVWGSSLLFFCLAAKQMGIDRSIFVFYLCIFMVQMSAVSRVCLPIAMSSFGLSFILSNQDGGRLIKIITGCVVIWLSMFFHRSAIFLLLVYPLALFRFDKKMIWLLIIAYPILITLVNLNIVDFFSNDFADDSLIDSSTAEYYLNYKKRAFGIGQIIYLALEYSCMIITLAILIKAINNGDYKKWPRYVQFFCNVYILTALFSTVFLFSLDGTTEKIFERLIGFAYFPQVVCLSYFLKMHYKFKSVKLVSYMITGYVLYSTLYFTLYLTE